MGLRHAEVTRRALRSLSPSNPSANAGRSADYTVARLLESERREEFVLHIRRVRLARNLFDDHAEQHVAGVGVRPLVAGVEVERVVVDERDDLPRRHLLGPAGAPRRFGRVVVDARRVVEELADGDLRPCVGTSGRYFDIGSSIDNFPRSAKRMIAADVNCLVIEPMR